MSDWITQNNGVKVRRTPEGYEIKYQDGSIAKAKTTHSMNLKVFMPHMPSIHDLDDPLTFTILGKPPTSNNAYFDQILRRKTAAKGMLGHMGEQYVMRRLTPVAKKYKEFVVQHIGTQRLKPRRYQVSLTVYAAWDTKTAKAASPVHGSDIASCEKLLMDALFDALMPDEDKADKWIWSLTLNKHHEPDKAKYRAVVTIRPWGETETQGGLF